MNLTRELLLYFFKEHDIKTVKTPKEQSVHYENVRLYYPGAKCEPGCLWVLDEMAYAQIAGRFDGAGFCVVSTEDKTVEGECFVVRTKRQLTEVFGLLQERMEALMRWDRELTELLLREAPLQELLACSEPVLRAPCFLQDANFHLLATSGAVTREENPFFYETLRTGNAPGGLFARLLSTSSPEPKAVSGAVRELSDQRVLIADCCVNGAAVLHFCLYYGKECRRDLRDLIVHLMKRLETGPSIRRMTSRSADLLDALFAKILDEPDAPDLVETCAALGLQRYQQFTSVCIAFSGRQTSMAARLARLRAMYPRFHFFQYREKLYAVLGSNLQTREADIQAQRALLQQLEGLGAACGVSLDGFPVRALGVACSQAAVALQLAGEAGCTVYSQVMVQHMLNDFFERHDFACYCPSSFRQMLEDDRTSGTGNLTLLRAFLMSNCNATAVSRQLHMHRNNVLYRVERIKAKYGLDLSNGDSRLMLQLLAEKAEQERRSAAL